MSRSSSSRLIPARAGKTGPPSPPTRPAKAHPRACGENAPGLDLADPESGSSPRVRGKPRPRRPRVVPARLIPARAGKTGALRPGEGSRRAHPRACGENFVAFGADVWSKGSSPRVRGKLAGHAGRVDGPGLIPARAGKTPHRRVRRPTPPAHPRACGENPGEADRIGLQLGSSPRVRGKPRGLGREGPWARLIPACAGKTRGPGPLGRFRAAHPRVCGENLNAKSSLTAGEGSSPRVRGKHPPLPVHRRPHRLIPACAGKTLRCGSERSNPRAHPRVCGENWPTRGTTLGGRGSSPRVRGKRWRRPWGPRIRGLIPACAGKTVRRWWWRSRCGAHPRACGENESTQNCVPCLKGSSPRVRGKPALDGGARAPSGLIPARAGKTPPTTAGTLRRPAHPRACGENLTGPIGVALGAGSSPRVRGKRMLPCMRPRCSRLIPARAGKTSRASRAGRRRRAHPRACGENGGDDGVLIGIDGSSPRVRGKLSTMRF